MGGPGPDPDTTPITPTKEITIAPSEWIDLDIFYTAPAGWTLASISVDIVATGPGTLNLDTLTDPTGAWDASFSVVTEVVAGKHYQVERAMLNGVAGTGAPVIALDHILLHCDDIGLVVITMTDNVNLPPQGTVEFDPGFNPSTPNFGGPVNVTQIPEPMTIVLLGLGGLFLRRRK